MKKIVSVIKPFVVNQNVFVYEDGNKIDVLSVPLNDIQNILVNTATQYEVTDIELIGSKKFLGISVGLSIFYAIFILTSFSKLNLLRWTMLLSTRMFLMYILIAFVFVSLFYNISILRHGK